MSEEMYEGRYKVRGSDVGGWYYNDTFDDADDAIQDASEFADYHEGHYFSVYVLETKTGKVLYEKEQSLQFSF